MKLNARRVVLFLLLVALSVGFGFAYDGVARSVERHRYPRPERYAATVSACSSEFGVPEAILWAVMRTESGFDSSLYDPETGAIGLFRITPETFSDVASRLLEGESDDPSRLYDPGTNLRAGAALLSDLYARYGVWKAVYAAWRTGTATVDVWMADPDLVSARGTLDKIPDKQVSAFVSAIDKAVGRYRTIYEG